MPTAATANSPKAKFNWSSLKTGACCQAHGKGLTFRRSHTPTTISAAMRTIIVHSSMVLSSPPHTTMSSVPMS